MTVSKEKIEISTLNGVVALVAILLSVGIYFGVAQSTDAQQTKDISELKKWGTKATVLTKDEFNRFVDGQKQMVELVRKAYPNY